MWHEYTGSVSESHVSSQTLGEVKKKKRKREKDEDKCGNNKNKKLI